MKTALINGKIYLEREEFAESVLVEDGTIKAVGTSEEILDNLEQSENPNKIIDLNGATVIPGLNDSHMHITHIAEYMTQPDTVGASSIENLIDRCKRFAEENPAVTARCIASTGWNQDFFVEGERRMPTRHDLDRISTEVPVVLTRICGHSLVCNTKALEMAGIDGNTPPVDGGTFEIGEDGYPTGFFTENAQELITKLIPHPTREEMKAYVVKAMEYAASKGLTSIQSNDIGSCYLGPRETLEMLQEVQAEGLGAVRYHAQMTYATVSELEGYIENNKSYAESKEIPGLFTIGPLKLFKDGSIGSRTALMRQDYVDDPGNKGVPVMDQELADALVERAAKAGMQVVTHAIGDRAVEGTVDSYEKVLVEGKNPLRHGVVHFQCMDKALLERTAGMGILALVQPVFLHADIGAVATRFTPEQNRYFLAFKTDLENGIHLAFGSDSPVEDCNPFNGIYCAVNRKTLNGEPEEGFFPEERLDIYEAVDCFTMGSAFAEFKENFKGRIKTGMAADMVVLDRDIFTCDPEELKDVRPILTMMGGRVVYEASK